MSEETEMAPKLSAAPRIVFTKDMRSPEVIALLKRTEIAFEEEANELSGITDAEWEYRLRVVAAARRELRYKHDFEVCELAAQMMHDALAAIEETGGAE
jgi:maltooligosyltrehalose synthase